MGVTETSIRNWVLQAQVDSGKGPPGRLTTVEHSEHIQLRKEVRELRMEHLGKWMGDKIHVPGISQFPSQPPDNIKPVHDLTENNRSTLRSQPLGSCLDL